MDKEANSGIQGEVVSLLSRALSGKDDEWTIFPGGIRTAKGGWKRIWGAWEIGVVH